MGASFSQWQSQIGGHVYHQGNVKTRPSVHHRLSIFSHAAVEHLIGIVIIKGDGVKVAGAQAPAAAHTVVMVHMHLLGALVKDQAAVGALPLAAAAAPAQLGVDTGLAAAVLLGLARREPQPYRYF